MPPAPPLQPPARARPRSRRRRLLLVAVVVLAAAVAAVAAGTASLTRLETYGGAASASPGRPQWVGPCYWKPPRRDRTLLERCARATGVVVRVRARGPDRKDEVHLAMVGRFGALIVKLADPRRLRTPSVGERITVVGPLVRASNGMREVEARTLL